MRFLETLSRHDLDQLIRETGPSLLSLVMPTLRAGQQSRQNPIRFKNMLERAEPMLGSGLPALRPQLEEARALLNDQAFWRHQSDAMLTYLGGEEGWCLRVPVTAEELIVVGRRFHLTPLLPLVGGDGSFYVLAVSQDEVRLLQCTGQRCAPLRLELPEGRQAIQQYVDGDREVQHHVAGAAGLAGSRQVAFHGHAGYKDQDKVRIFEYLRTIDDALHRQLRGARTPVIFAGVDYLFPIFREAARSINLVPEHLSGNFDSTRVSDEQLHREALAIVATRFAEHQRAALSRWTEAAGTGRVQVDPKRIVADARGGRIERLYLDTAGHAWGRIDGERVEMADQQRPGDEDLLNFCAVETLQHGGDVYPLAAEQVPTGAAMAALYRY